MPNEDDPGPPAQATSQQARQEAAQAMRRLLAAVESGELEATSANAKALLRRIEGAVVGLEADEGTPSPERRGGMEG